MQTHEIVNTLNTYTKDQLVEMIMTLGVDSTFKLITRDMAKLFHSTIKAGQQMIFIDLANIHGLNHAYSMSLADQFINNVLNVFRHNDTWIRWGSDEIVVIMESGEVCDLIDRLHIEMLKNNLYAVYGIITTSNNLEESVNRADAIVMNAKLQLEKFGLKADRNELYSVKTSVVVSE